MKKSDLTRRAKNYVRSFHKRYAAQMSIDEQEVAIDAWQSGYRAARADLQRQLGADAKSAMIGSASAFRIGVVVRKWLRPIR